MTIRKFIWAVGTTVLFAAGLGLTFAPSSSATYEDPPGDCVPSEDHFQRYSWTGGPHEGDDPPAFPSDDWQPNVEGDPHGIGHAGAYFVSHGGSGLGDWFYLELVPGVVCPPDTTVPPTTAPTTTQTPPTSSIPDEPTGSIDVDKTVHGDPDCEDGEPCFVIDIDCEDLDFTQVYDRSGHLIDGDSTYHDIPPGTVCIVTETVTGGADSVTYDPANANTTGVVITAEDPDNGRDQRVHVMVTNDFDECEVDCEPPPTTVPPTTVPPTTVPPTTVPPTTVPPTTVVPPPTTVVPPPPSTVPTCEDNPNQTGCDQDRLLPRTGDNTGQKVVGAFALIAGGYSFLKLRKRFV